MNDVNGGEITTSLRVSLRDGLWARKVLRRARAQW